MTPRIEKNKSTVSEMLKEFLAKNNGEEVFVEFQIKALLRELGLPVPKGMIIRKGAAETMPGPSDLVYPLAAKVSSRKIVSKSEVGGVRVGIHDKKQLDAAAAELLAIENAEAVYLEEMAPTGFEVIVGGMVDDQFGPVVMLGLGGLFVEFFRETIFTLAPLSKDQAFAFLKRFRAFRLFERYRGRPALDIDAILRIIVVMSELMASSMIAEIDLNPVALYPQGAMILDAKMQLRSPG